MKPKYQLLFVLLSVVLVTLACDQIDIGIEQETPTPEPIIESEEPEPNPTDPIDFRDEPQKPNDSQYWVAVKDPRTQLQFALPCFWSADFPLAEMDPTSLGSESFENFSEQFVTSLGPKRGEVVWELGGMKFDLGYHKFSDFGLPQNASLDQLAYALVNPDQEHGIDALTSVAVDGKQGVRVDTWSTFGQGSFYLLPYINDLIILFAPYPESITNHPDIQAILNSFTLSPESELELPNILPAYPPEGMAASCMPPRESTNLPTTNEVPETFTGPLECNSVTEDDALLWSVCNVRDSILSRNTQPLMGYMTDPFTIAYWQSEGASRSREEAFNEIVQTHLAGTPGGETFTTDRSQFPPLFGMPPENMFGPDDNPAAILYSEGWGQDGQGAALLYFKEASDGRVMFYAILIAQGHFDK